MNKPKGKVFWIHKIKNCEGGDGTATARKLIAAGVKVVIIKILDGAWAYNQRPLYDASGRLTWVDDIIQPFVQALQEVGIDVWGFAYIYPDYPQMQAEAAIARVKWLRLAGLVIDGETEMKGHADAARVYCQTLRIAGAVMTIALSSYRFPTLHMNFPWDSFRPFVDLYMPQVYWMGARNPVEQLDRCIQEYGGIGIKADQIIPVGSAFYERGWQATPDEVVAFLRRAIDRGFEAASLWEYWYIENIPEMWGKVAAFNWPSGEPSPAEKLPLDRFVREQVHPFMVSLGYNGPGVE